MPRQFPFLSRTTVFGNIKLEVAANEHDAGFTTTLAKSATKSSKVAKNNYPISLN